jgi:peptide/histidine transporter 3/4
MENGEGGGGEYTKDGSVDLRGNPVLRSKRGGWTACTFIVGTHCTFFVVREIQSQLAALSRFSGRPAGSNVSPPGFASRAHGPWIYAVAAHAYAVYELFERMAYYGVAANLVVYLTERLHQGTVQAANNVTNWSGTVFLTPLLGAFLADAYLGRYWTFVAGSAVYLLVCTSSLISNYPSS